LVGVKKEQIHSIKLPLADLPTSHPHIYGLRSSYKVGSLLNLTCESGPSSPPTTLFWFLNGEKISHDSPLVTEMDAVYPLANKRAISRSLLSLHLTEDRLPKHPYPVMVKCVAVIREFYRKSVKARVSILGRKKVKGGVKETSNDGTTEGFVSSAAHIFTSVTYYWLLKFYLVILF
jgi:hypothetical protein